jgi:cytochrome c oxidase subunit 2
MGVLGALALLALVAGGCGRTQNALAPESHQARDIASLFWWMMGGAWIGLGLVVWLLVLSWKRRQRRGFGSDTAGEKPGERASWAVVVGSGIVLPIAILAALFVIADIFVIQTTQAPAKTATKLTVEVIGHQWWWEFRYPGTKAVTANEMHIPVRTPVRVEVRTADVIHSFWIPELNRKIDAIPGMTNAIELDADAVGSYRGQCAEFCGLQHTHMATIVFVDPPDVFRRWLANEARAARPPASAAARTGQTVFTAGPCSSCHAIRGTSASGDVGPDLTHLASRSTLASVTIPNRKGDLESWILDSQHVKPGNQMPNIDLGGRQLQDLLAYLEGLR